MSKKRGLKELLELYRSQLISYAGDFNEVFHKLRETISSKVAIETELKLTARIQNQLLKHNLPNLDNLDVYYILKPAKEVGGDYIDFYVKDNYFFIIIGDVMGKNLNASLLMSCMRSCWRTLVNLNYNDPSKMLEIINLSTYKDFLENDKFATLFCGVIDLINLNIVYSNAGHNPPVYISGDNYSLLDTDDGYIIGLEAEARYSNKLLKLNTNDIIVFYTDGLIEARDENKNLFGYDRLKDVIQRNREKSSKEITEEIINEINLFISNSNQVDDMVICTLKLK